jgi:hypothetical protein
MMRSLLEAHLASQQVARVVYGTIIGLAIVVGLESHPPPPGAVVATLLGTAVAVGLAELYSEVLGAATRTRRRIERERLRTIVDEVGAVAFGIGFPAVFFALSAAGAMKAPTAFTLAKWSGLGLTSFYGFAASRLAGEGLLSALLYAAAIGAVGGFLIALKALVH